MIFEAVIANKPFILSVYRSVSRDQIENYLFRLTWRPDRERGRGEISWETGLGGGQAFYSRIL